MGVDSSAEVIATAKAKAAERDSEERTGSVTFEVASAYELPYVAWTMLGMAMHGPMV